MCFLLKQNTKQGINIALNPADYYDRFRTPQLNNAFKNNFPNDMVVFYVLFVRIGSHVVQ